MNGLAEWLVAAAGGLAVEGLVWSWQALVLLAGVSLLIKICRARSPALRHQIWLLGLLAVAALPWWSMAALRFPALQPASHTLSYVAQAPRLVVEIAPRAAVQELPAALPTGVAALSPAAAARRSSTLFPLLLAGLFSLWAIGALVIALRVAKSCLELRRAHALAESVCTADLDCAESEALGAGRVSLRLSPEVSSPVLYGLFRPAILLPADIVEWTTPAERAAMIAHELAHVERRDMLVNLFQTALQTVFFFHPAVRYACREMSLEREMACDDRVIGMGAAADVYAEGILKVAERSLAPRGAHQLALFSAREILERRIEMILNADRVRMAAREWRYLIVPAGLIAVVAWLLIPAAGFGLAQTSDTKDKLQLVKSLGESKAFADLLEMALRNPDAELRRLAAIRLTELEGDGSTEAMAELYHQTSDPEVKRIVIDTLGRISEIELLTKIALLDLSPDNRLRALMKIKWLKETSESADVKAWDVSALAEQLDRLSAPPPPPPPPPPSSEMTVESDKAPARLRWHEQSDSVFALLQEAAYAHMRRDTSFFERILDEDYIGIGPDGVTRNKAEEIAEVRRLDYEIKRFEFDDLRVSGNEGMAFATFLGTVYIQAGDQESTVQNRYTVNFTRRDGQLKVAAIHISRKS